MSSANYKLCDYPYRVYYSDTLMLRVVSTLKTE